MLKGYKALIEKFTKMNLDRETEFKDHADAIKVTVLSLEELYKDFYKQFVKIKEEPNKNENGLEEERKQTDFEKR